MIWTASNLARLQELQALGLSWTRIGEQMGVTKSAISGAMARHIRPPRVAAPPVPPPPVAWPQANQCKWIHDDGPWHHRVPDWCAAPVRPGSAYCDEHHQRCFVALR